MMRARDAGENSVGTAAKTAAVMAPPATPWSARAATTWLQQYGVRSGEPRQRPRRVLDQDPIDVGFSNAGVAQHGHEAGEHVVVALATPPVQQPLEAHVVRQQDLIDIPQSH